MSKKQQKPPEEIHSEIRLITPKWAKEQLDENVRRIASGQFRNRPLRDGAIRRYAQDMKQGKWVVTHQGIAFDTDGNLQDGQNRLNAVVRSGVSVRMMVTTGMPVEHDNGLRTMDVLDQGVGRNIWQALQISHGYTGAALELASIARNIGRMVLSNPNRRTNRDHRQSMSISQALFILEDLDYRSAAERLVTLIPTKSFRPASLSAPWTWYYKIHPRKAEQFATDYSTLQNLGKGHPALLLFRYISMKNLRPRKAESSLMAIVANALWTYHVGGTMNAARASDDAHLWLLKLNWPHTEKLTELLVSEKAAEQPEPPAEMIEQEEAA